MQADKVLKRSRKVLRSNIHSFTHPPVLRARENVQASETAAAPDLCAEKHYSLAELAHLWNLSEKTIRRMFEKEPGVLQWGKVESRSKRGYTTLRIPESIALRVHRRLRIAG